RRRAEGRRDRRGGVEPLGPAARERDPARQIWQTFAIRQSRLLIFLQTQTVCGEETMLTRLGARRPLATVSLVFTVLIAALGFAAAADPLRIGWSLSLTGPTAPAGKQVLAGLEIWRDDVNNKGGLLGRPVQLVYYDDQGNPSNAPAIYAKLMGVDKVDLLIGPYSTNIIAAALPAIIQNKRMTIGIFGLGANKQYKYARYFSMNSQGASPRNYSRGLFELAL